MPGLSAGRAIDTSGRARGHSSGPGLGSSDHDGDDNAVVLCDERLQHCAVSLGQFARALRALDRPSEGGRVGSRLRPSLIGCVSTETAEHHQQHSREHHDQSDDRRDLAALPRSRHTRTSSH